MLGLFWMENGGCAYSPKSNSAPVVAAVRFSGSSDAPQQQ